MALGGLWAGSGMEELGDVIVVDAGEFGELVDGDKLSLLFIELLSDTGKQFSCGPFFAAGDIGNVFGIYDYALWYCLLHNPAFAALLLFFRFIQL